MVGTRRRSHSKRPHFLKRRHSLLRRLFHQFVGRFLLRCWQPRRSLQQRRLVGSAPAPAQPVEYTSGPSSHKAGADLPRVSAQAALQPEGQYSIDAAQASVSMAGMVDVPEDVQRHILGCLANLADRARASCVSTAWRQIACDLPGSTELRLCRTGGSRSPVKHATSIRPMLAALEGVVSSGKHAALREIDLCGVGNATALFPTLQHFSCLQKLQLRRQSAEGFTGYPIRRGVWPLVQHMPVSIAVLELSVALSEHTLWLAQFERLPNLTALKLCLEAFGSRNCKVWGTFAHAALQTLHIGLNTRTSNGYAMGTSLAGHPALPQLRELTLWEVDMEDNFRDLLPITAVVSVAEHAGADDVAFPGSKPPAAASRCSSDLHFVNSLGSEASCGNAGAGPSEPVSDRMLRRAHAYQAQGVLAEVVSRVCEDFA